MPNVSLKLRPGVNVNATPALLEAGFQNASCVRFRDGLPEKIGGWSRYYPSAVTGVPRDVHPWQIINGDGHLGVGTTTNLFDIANSTLTDISPQMDTNNPAIDCSTTAGDATVTIVDASLTEVTAGNYVYIATPIAVGGLILHGVYQIATRASATSYTIEAATNASGNVSNGGATIDYDTTQGSDLVTCTLAAHNLAVGDTINIPIATTLGGITIAAGTYSVITAPTSSTFTIRVANAASSTAGAFLNSGNARYVYYIAPRGDILRDSGTGFVMYGALGQFAIGQLTDGTPSVTPTQTGTATTQDNWQLDNLGEFLIAAPRNGAAYYWRPNVGMETAALMSSDAPIYNRGILVDPVARIVVCFGSTAKATVGVEQDPLLIRWSDQEDFTVWTATTVNYAGSYRVPTGSEIVGALAAQRVILVWTDIDVYSMQYVGGQGTQGGVSLVYSFSRLDTACGLVAQHAATVFAGDVFWMGQRNFFRLTGNGAQVIPCPVWDVIFQDLDVANKDKIACVPNTPFNEVWWFYPSLSGGTGDCDKYIKLNTLTGAWDYGAISGSTAIARTCGCDQSVLGMPIMADPSGILYQHENTYNADGAAISWSWQTGDFVLNEARDVGFVDEIYPDFKFGTFAGASDATLQLTIYGKNQPNDTPTTFGPFTVTSATQVVKPRFRGRLMSLKVSGSDSATWSRLGNMRMRVAIDGRQ